MSDGVDTHLHFQLNAEFPCYLLEVISSSISESAVQRIVTDVRFEGMSFTGLVGRGGDDLDDPNVNTCVKLV